MIYSEEDQEDEGSRAAAISRQPRRKEIDDINIFNPGSLRSLIATVSSQQFSTD